MLATQTQDTLYKNSLMKLGFKGLLKEWQYNSIQPCASRLERRAGEAVVFAQNALCLLDKITLKAPYVSLPHSLWLGPNQAA